MTHDAPGSDDGSVADRHSGEDECLMTKPNVVADHDGPLGARCPLGEVTMSLIERWISWKAVRRYVVGAVFSAEHNVRPVGERTELANTQVGAWPTAGDSEMSPRESPDLVLAEIRTLIQPTC